MLRYVIEDSPKKRKRPKRQACACLRSLFKSPASTARELLRCLPLPRSLSLSLCLLCSALFFLWVSTSGHWNVRSRWVDGLARSHHAITNPHEVKLAAPRPHRRGLLSDRRAKNEGPGRALLSCRRIGRGVVAPGAVKNEIKNRSRGDQAIDFSDADWKPKFQRDFESRFDLPHLTDVFPNAVPIPSTFCLRMRSPTEDFAGGYPSDEKWHGYINNSDRVLLKVS